MALTNEGLEILRQPESLEEINQRQKDLIHPDFPNDPDTLVGEYNNIYAEREALLYELLQDIYDTRNLDNAEGKALDDLVSVLGIKRLAATATSGEQFFVGDEGTSLITGDTVKSPTSQATYELTEDVEITGDSCRIAKIDVENVVDGQEYTVTIKGTAFNYTAMVGATKLSILNGLNTQINNALPTGITSAVVSNILTITSTNNADITVMIGDDLVFSQVISAGKVKGTEKGPTSQSANTVTIIGDPSSGWTATYNPSAFTVGRDRETDSELRIRAKISSQGAGLATLNAITRVLLGISGVSFVNVLESTASFPIAGQPTGSISPVIVGGDDDDIAAGILRSRAAGIESFGASSGTATDISGASRTEYFDRPTPIPDANGMYVEVRFDLFDDEVFPSPEGDGIQAIKDAIVDYGNSLGNGTDVDPGRFFGPIYNSVQGISNLTVEMSTDGVTFSTATISIADNEVAVFVDNSRLDVAKNP